MAVKRFISAMVGLALFFTVILLPPYVFGLAIFLISAAAIYEYNASMRKAGHKVIDAIVYLTPLVIIFSIYVFEKGYAPSQAVKYSAVLYILLFLTMMLLYMLRRRLHVLTDIFATVYAMAYLAPLFCSLVWVRYLDHGNYHIYIAFGGAWVTDTFAYFAGRLFGRRKLIPEISPNKTIEGAIGGLAGTTAVTVLYGYILNTYVYSDKINIAVFIVLGIMLSVFSQVGDLAASAVKRYAGIKDFGNVMPGHGGVIDRFDSVLFSSAVTLIYVIMFF